MTGQREGQAPEDAIVIAEVLRRVRDAVGGMSQRAGGDINALDLWHALDDAYSEASREVAS